MVPGNLIPTMTAERSIRGNPDAYEVYQGLSVTIPISSLLANDTDIGGYLPLTIVKIINIVNGTATMTGGFINFTSTGAVGAPAGFDYVVKNTINEEHTVNVVITVAAKPPLVTTSDTYDVTQGEQVLITAASLITNDTSTFPPITVQSVGGAYGGSVELINNNITFTSTAKTGTQAGFTYTARDAANVTAVGNVYMNVTPLPATDAYVYMSSEEASAMMSDYVPPSMQTVFNTWHRFDRANYYPYGTTPGGEANSWAYNATTGVITATVNSVGHIGFVSPDLHEYYTHDCTLSSNNTDDDMIGIVIAFKRDGTTNKSLVAGRSGGGVASGSQWFVWSNVTTAYDVNYKKLDSTVYNTKGGWSTIGATRVRVQREGDIITLYTSKFKSTAFEPTSKMVIDLSADPALEWARGPQAYGYCCFSQLNSAFTNSTFKGGLEANYIYDGEANAVYQFDGGSWVLTGMTIAEHIGFPRTITNPKTNKKYYIDYNGNINPLN